MIDLLASDLKHIFQVLEWIERKAVASTAHFTERKQFQTNVTVGCLQNQENVMHVVTNDQVLASFRRIQGTPQHFYDMLLDVFR